MPHLSDFIKEIPDCDHEYIDGCAVCEETIAYNRWVTDSVKYEIDRHLVCSWAIGKSQAEIEAKALEILAWVVADEERCFEECPAYQETEKWVECVSCHHVSHEDSTFDEATLEWLCLGCVEPVWPPSELLPGEVIYA